MEAYQPRGIVADALEMYRAQFSALTAIPRISAGLPTNTYLSHVSAHNSRAAEISAPDGTQPREAATLVAGFVSCAWMKHSSGSSDE
jgi:hypothetical protein